MQEFKINQNYLKLKEFFNNNSDNSDNNSDNRDNHQLLLTMIIEYPMLLSKCVSSTEKLYSYFKLYLDMSKEEFINIAIKFPLLLTVDV